MSVCKYIISQDIAVDCDDPIVNGIEPNGVIINRDDIDFGSSTVTGNVISAIALKSGKKGYKIAQGGSTPFTGTNSAFVAGTYRNTYTKQVSMVVLANDPDVCSKVIDGLANGQFVVILENKFKGLGKETGAGNAAFEVFGWYNGLKQTEGSNDKYSEDTDGGWSVTLEETKSPKAAMFLYSSSYEATKTLVDGLTTASA